MIADQRDGVGKLLRRRRSPERESHRLSRLALDSVAVPGRRVTFDARGKRLGHLDRERAVDEVEGLDRRRRLAAAGHRLAGIGAVEGAKHALLLHPHLVGVDHPLQPVAGKRLHRREAVEAAARTKQIEASAPHRGVEKSAHGEHRIADPLRLEAARWIAPQKPVARVLGEPLGRGRIPLPVGGGEDDGAVERFERPAVRDKLRSEPVEQLRMARGGARSTEVARCLDKAGAEVPLPHPVGDHTGGERIGRVNDPVGKRHPPGLLGGIGGQGKRRKPVIEGQRRARADFIARLFRIAAVEHARGLGRREAPGEDG